MLTIENKIGVRRTLTGLDLVYNRVIFSNQDQNGFSQARHHSSKFVLGGGEIHIQECPHAKKETLWCNGEIHDGAEKIVNLEKVKTRPWCQCLEHASMREKQTKGKYLNTSSKGELQRALDLIDELDENLTKLEKLSYPKQVEKIGQLLVEIKSAENLVPSSWLEVTKANAYKKLQTLQEEYPKHQKYFETKFLPSSDSSIPYQPERRILAHYGMPGVEILEKYKDFYRYHPSSRLILIPVQLAQMCYLSRNGQTHSVTVSEINPQSETFKEEMEIIEGLLDSMGSMGLKKIHQTAQTLV